MPIWFCPRHNGNPAVFLERAAGNVHHTDRARIILIAAANADFVINQSSARELVISVAVVRRTELKCIHTCAGGGVESAGGLINRADRVRTVRVARQLSADDDVAAGGNVGGDI